MFSLTTPSDGDDRRLPHHPDGELPLEWRVSYPSPPPPSPLEGILAPVLCEVGILTRRIPTFGHSVLNSPPNNLTYASALIARLKTAPAYLYRMLPARRVRL
jgi:hypothetical protein